MAAAEIRLIPMFEDNYAYLITCAVTNEAALVDPAQPKAVLEVLKAETRPVRLTTLLTTHKHWDHAGGNEEMARAIPGLRVVGGEMEDTPIPACTLGVKEGDVVTVGALRFRVLFTPCHTRGHVLYFLENCSPPALFSGDTLFLAGCGRFFEGDAADMHRAMYEVIGRLPPETEVYCGHEYSVNNLRFAVHVEPGNAAAAEKLEWAKQQRAAGRPTIPSTLAEEKRYNPFMRVHEESLARAVRAEGPVAVMRAVRAAKDAFK
eukprot:tig00000507_g1763.t1